MITVGSELTVVIEGITIEDGSVVMVCRDSTGWMWQMAHMPGKAPSSPVGVPPAAPPRRPFTRLEALPAAPTPPSGHPDATTDPGRPAPPPAPRHRPTPWSSVSDIAGWIAAHPEEILRFGGGMTLHKRRLVGEKLAAYVGPAVRNTEAFRRFVSPEDSPDMIENAKRGDATWGADDSIGSSILGIDDHAALINKQERQTVVVDEFLRACRVEKPETLPAEELAARFAESLKD